MDFAIADDNVFTLGSSSLEKGTNNISNGGQRLIDLTFVDHNIFQSYLASAEYNDPGLKKDGVLFHLTKSKIICPSFDTDYYDRRLR